MVMHINESESSFFCRYTPVRIHFKFFAAWYIITPFNKHRWRMGLLSIPTTRLFHHCQSTMVMHTNESESSFFCQYTPVSPNGVIFIFCWVVHKLSTATNTGEGRVSCPYYQLRDGSTITNRLLLCVLMNLNLQCSAGTRQSVGMESFPICGA